MSSLPCPERQTRGIGWLPAALSLLLADALVALSAGCGGNSAGRTAGQPAATTAPGGADTAGNPAFVHFFSPPKQAGAQLWSDNCNRCHYAPAPTDFSASQWDLIMQHMRLRANLTGEEARTIAEFLKAAS